MGDPRSPPSSSIYLVTATFAKFVRLLIDGKTRQMRNALPVFRQTFPWSTEKRPMIWSRDGANRCVVRYDSIPPISVQGDRRFRGADRQADGDGRVPRVQDQGDEGQVLPDPRTGNGERELLVRPRQAPERPSLEGQGNPTGKGTTLVILEPLQPQSARRPTPLG